MPSWEHPRHESSLLAMAKFAPDDKDVADALETVTAAVTGQEEIAVEKAEQTLSDLATQTGTMDLQFQNGRVYSFFSVPYRVYRELLDATSPGSYYNQVIRGNYAG